MEQLRPTTLHYTQVNHVVQPGLVELFDVTLVKLTHKKLVYCDL